VQETAIRPRGPQATTLRKARRVVRQLSDAVERDPNLSKVDFVAHLELRRTNGRPLTIRRLYRYLKLVDEYGME
jgi:hypothetical protein